MSNTKRILLTGLVVTLAGCSAVVSDLNGFTNSTDVCDPRGTPHLGEDLDIQFFNTTAHVNQDMRFAVEVGTDRAIEAMFVVSAFDDPNLNLHVPEVLPSEPATLAFWADSNGVAGFQMLPDMGSTDQPDHQWFRPICPNGMMTFTHTTPFQDISMASSTGLVFQFPIPTEWHPGDMTQHELFDRFRMAVWAVRTNALGRQTRAYYRWSPLVPLAPGLPTPMQRAAPTVFQVGGNVIGETRGAIDSGEMYELHFVIDVNGDGAFEGSADYVCQWTERAPDTGMFVVTYDPMNCDHPGSFDPANPATFPAP